MTATLQKPKSERNKPNFIIAFDGKEYSDAERNYLITRFIQVLTRLNNEAVNCNTFENTTKGQ
jgi:hypothetical protein